MEPGKSIESEKIKKLIDGHASGTNQCSECSCGQFFVLWNGKIHAHS